MNIVCFSKAKAFAADFAILSRLVRFGLFILTNVLALFLISTDAKAQLLISAYLPNAKGSDGNFEYIQLMALDSIDFTETPHTIITCNNGNALKTNGWVSGLTCTYAMEINSGSINRGETLYVGGINSVLNGPGSEDISDLNWVKQFDCLSMLGDGGIGSRRAKNFGFLGNGGDADGIAVFCLKASEISAASIPSDALFYGDTITKSGTYGYTLPNGSLFDKDSKFFPANSAKDNILYKVHGWYNHLTKEWVKERNVLPVPLLSRDSLATAIEFVPLVYDITNIYEDCKLSVNWEAFPSADSFAVFISTDKEPVALPKNGTEYEVNSAEKCDSIENSSWRCVYSGSEKTTIIENLLPGDYQLSVFPVFKMANYKTELYMNEYQTIKFTIKKDSLPQIMTDSTICIHSPKICLNATDFVSDNKHLLSVQIENETFNCPKPDSIYKTKLTTFSECGERNEFELSIKFKTDSVKSIFANCPKDTTVYVKCGRDSFYFAPPQPDFDDICGYYSIETKHSIPAYYKVGKHLLTFYLTDSQKIKMDSCSYYLNVVKTAEPPKIICPKDTTIYIEDGACEAYFSPNPPIATNGTFTRIQPNGATLSDGDKATFLFVAEDDCKESSDSCAITATAKDTTDVHFLNCPTDKSMELKDGQQDTTLYMEEILISKDCGTYYVQGDPNSIDQTFNPGLYNFTYHIKDNADNIVKTCKFSILITKERHEPSYDFDDTYQKKIMTPNSDGINDFFEINDIDSYPENELIVFNKWGSVVFRQKNYANTWNGVNMSNNRFESGRKLPPSTYFYIFYGEENIKKSGFIEIFY